MPSSKSSRGFDAPKPPTKRQATEAEKKRVDNVGNKGKSIAQFFGKATTTATNSAARSSAPAATPSSSASLPPAERISDQPPAASAPPEPESGYSAGSASSHPPPEVEDDEDDFGYDAEFQDAMDVAINRSLEADTSTSAHASTSASAQEPADDDGETPSDVSGTDLVDIVRNFSNGSDCELTLRAVITHMVSLVVCIANATLENAPGLFSGPSPRISVAELVDVFINGMTPALSSYLDTCIRNGRPWDMRQVMTMLYSREQSKGQFGCYLIQLLCGPKNRMYMYGGSCQLFSSVIAMYHRLYNQHFNEEYRKEDPQKMLYKLWSQSDSQQGGMLFKWPDSRLPALGALPNVVLEVVSISLAASWRNGNLPSLFNKIYPRSLLDAFTDALDLTEISPQRIFQEALSSASGYGVRGTNGGNPLHEAIAGRSVYPIFGLMKGAVVLIHGGTGSYPRRFRISNVFSFSITAQTWDELCSKGFTKEIALIAKIELADKPSKEHWAQLPNDGVTKTNPQGYEDARRILLELSFTDANEQRQSTYIKHSGHYNTLERACLAMSMLEFATGVLPRESFGPRRRNLLINNESEAKVWHHGQTESQGLVAVHRYKCMNPACDFKTAELKALRVHYCFLGSPKVTDRAIACRTAAGVSSVEDISADNHAIPGAPRNIAKVPRFECKACKTQFSQFSDLKQHFYFGVSKRNPIPGPRVQRCRAGHIPGTVITQASDLTRENSVIQ